MKTTYTIFSFLLLFAYTSFAQITITAEQGKRTIGEVLHYTKIKNIESNPPDTGQNMVWDYSHLVPCHDCDFTDSIHKNTSKNYPNSDFIWNGTRIILGMSVPCTSYCSVDKEGDVYRDGRETPAITLSIKNVTGNPLDSIKLQHNIELAKGLIRDFPFEYGKTWASKQVGALSFLVNGHTLGLVNFPLDNIIKSKKTRSIVGYGKLVLPFYKGNKMQKLTYDALLVKEDRNGHGLIESEGNEAILDQIEQAIGLKQNYVNSMYYYRFYVREIPKEVLQFTMTSSGEIKSIHFSTDLMDNPPMKD